MSGLSLTFSLLPSQTPAPAKQKHSPDRVSPIAPDEIPTPEFRQSSRKAPPELRWEPASVVRGQDLHKMRQLSEFSDYQLQGTALVPLHQAFPGCPPGIYSNHDNSTKQIMKQNIPPDLHSHGRSIGF
ncbi:MAG: hypothetical protein Fur0025_29690 [Oscillatoriaceae cyanobacterium]